MQQEGNYMTFKAGDNSKSAPATPDVSAPAPEATIAPPAVAVETKSERFKRLAEYRTKRILKNIRSLAKLSNKSAYEYSEEQLNEIYNAIANEINVAVSKFKGTKNAEPDFKLS